MATENGISKNYYKTVLFKTRGIKLNKLLKRWSQQLEHVKMLVGNLKVILLDLG